MVLGWERSEHESIPDVTEFYGLGSEDRWIHELNSGGIERIQRYVSKFIEMSTMVKKIKIVKCRYTCERERKRR